MDIRLDMNGEFSEVLHSSGPGEAYRHILTILQGTPKGLRERVCRAYMYRFLPYLVQKDPTLRMEILDFLERRAREDQDPYGRLVALATLLDYRVEFLRRGEETGFWYVNTHVRVVPGSKEDYDFACTDVTLQTNARLRRFVSEGIRCEMDVENRCLLVRSLAAAGPDAHEMDQLARCALSDPHRSVRYWALDALAGSSQPQSVLGILAQAMGSDGEEANRQAAALRLVKLGVANDAVIANLLNIRLKDAAFYKAIVRAHSLSGSSRTMRCLQDGLASEGLRTKALAGIRCSGDRRFIPLLHSTLEKEPDADRKDTLVGVIEELELAP